MRTATGAEADAEARTIQLDGQKARSDERRSLAALVEQTHPSLAQALRRSDLSPAAHTVLVSVVRDLVDGIQHAGPRAFAQHHFGNTKQHDVREILTVAGVDDDVLELLGLRRGDRIGLGGPITLSLPRGEVDLAPLRGPVQLRLDQPDLHPMTFAPLVAIIENLQPAEIVCLRHPDLPVVYSGGQFDDAASLVLAQLCSGRRAVAIVDADLGGVRIAQRVLAAVPHAEIVDVGEWPHTRGERISADGLAAAHLERLVEDPAVGSFAAAVRQRGYRVEQEQSTLAIVESLLG